jgi:hypothetical protein
MFKVLSILMNTDMNGERVGAWRRALMLKYVSFAAPPQQPIRTKETDWTASRAGSIARMHSFATLS